MTRSPRRAASVRTAGEMPCALKITVASSGTSVSSSTKMAPCVRSVSTTWRLWTISRRTYTGGRHTERASSTMSIARSTPAQKPRGPARTISETGADMVSFISSFEERGYSDHTGVRFEAAIAYVGIAVGDVLQPIPRVERDAISDEHGGTRAGEDQEREVGIDLQDVEVGA